MDTGRTRRFLGRFIFGVGLMALALVCLAWGDFDPGQAVPSSFPARTSLAYASGTFMLLAGVSVQWRRSLAAGAAALTAYYAFAVVILMNGRVIIAEPTEFGAYSSAAEQLAIAAGALMLYAGSADIRAISKTRLVRVAQIAFGLCALLFGAAHFVYLNLTVPLVPAWLPPSAQFWAYATGVAHMAAGLAPLTGVRARLAAILLTVMFASFTPLVHVPTLFADPFSHWNWAENALNLALTGVAWVTADSLRSPT